jgi:plastocyanin
MIRPWALFFAVPVLAAVLASGCGVAPSTGRGDAPAEVPGPAPHIMPAKQPGKPTAAVQVTIDNFTFDPPEVTIPVGGQVTWLNRDDVPHTATSTARPKAFDSGSLDTDQKYTHTFDKAGVFEYFCAVHPKMTARVVVK